MSGPTKTRGLPSTVVSDPSGKGTADFAVLKEVVPNPLMAEYGAKGDGATDDTAALQAFLNAGLSYGKIPTPPGGAYNVSSGLALPASMSLDLDHFAKIKATASMAAILTTATNTFMIDKALRGGIFDCNQLANSGVLVPWAVHRYELENVTVYSPLQHAMIVGDTTVSSGVPSDGAIVRNFNVFRPSAQSVPAGYYGLWMRFVTDAQTHGSFIVGMDTGVRNDQANNKFLGIHVWGYNGLTVGFDDNNDGQWYDCCVDDPSTYGMRLRQHRSLVVGGRTYISKNALDNLVTGIYFDQASPVGSILGYDFRGASGAARLSKDVAGSGSILSAVILGSKRLNVVTTVQDQLGISVGGFNITAGQNKIALPTSFSGSMGLANGTNLQGYSGNFSGQTFNLDPASGAIQPGNKAAGTSALGSRIWSGSGAPTSPGNVNPTAGDYYLRTDTPGTANQRLYVCTTGGASPVWSGIA